MFAVAPILLACGCIGESVLAAPTAPENSTLTVNPSGTATGTTTAQANRTVTATYTAAAKTYYVSGLGSDSNDGLSRTAAFRTLQHAAAVTQPGDTVYVMNGTYTNSCAGCDVLDISTAGTQDRWITYKAYPGQNPIIRFNGWAGISFKPTAAYV